jgi:hypothetical protein
MYQAYWGILILLRAFLTSALPGKWSASHPDRFIPGEWALFTSWIGGSVAQEPIWTLRCGEDKKHVPRAGN